MKVYKETLDIYGGIVNVDVVYLDINIGDPPIALGTENFNERLYNRKGFSLVLCLNNYCQDSFDSGQRYIVPEPNKGRGDIFLTRYNDPSFVIRYDDISYKDDAFLNADLSDKNTAERFFDVLKQIEADFQYEAARLSDLFILGEIIGSENFFRKRFPLLSIMPSLQEGFRKAKKILDKYGKSR